jgi:hypothetical protein
MQWLRTDIETAYGFIPRHRMIRFFVKNGLIPFIESKGYKLNGDLKWTISLIASGLYESQFKHHLESKWPVPTNVDYDEEDMDHFYHIMDSDTWGTFWENWGAWEDMEHPQFGEERRLDIQNFVWNHVDIAVSQQTIIVDKLFEDDEPHEEGGNSRRHEDVYTRDVAESNEWGGYRR